MRVPFSLGLSGLMLICSSACVGGQPCISTADCAAGEYCTSGTCAGSISGGQEGTLPAAPTRAATTTGGTSQVFTDGTRIVGIIGPRAGIDAPGVLDVQGLVGGFVSVTAYNEQEGVLLMATLEQSLISQPLEPTPISGTFIQGCSGMNQEPMFDVVIDTAQVTVTDGPEGQVVEVTSDLEGNGNMATLRFKWPGDNPAVTPSP